MSVLSDLDDLVPAKDNGNVVTLPLLPQQPKPIITGDIPHWARFKDRFAEAMGSGLYSVDDVEHKIRNGHAIFFPAKNSAIIGEPIQYAEKRIFQVTWAVGDISEIVAMSQGIEALARSLGCSEMIIEGRRGWEKTMKESGYEFWSVTLKKDLSA